MTEPIYVLTPVGRMLQGDPFLLQEKVFNGKKQMKDDGTPKIDMYIGLAVPKGPEWDAFWLALQQKAQQDFPNGVSLLPGFAWKVEDGDLPKFAGKEGYAGNVLIKMSSTFLPDCYDPDYNRLTDKSQLARGDFVQVQVAIKGNGAASIEANAGMYLNPSSVIRVAFGPRISSAPDPRTIFTAQAVPAGGSLTPLAPAGGMPAPQVQVQGAALAPAVTQVPVVPLHFAAPGVVAGAVAPPMPGAAPVAPATVDDTATGVVAAPGFINPGQ